MTRDIKNLNRSEWLSSTSQGLLIKRNSAHSCTMELRKLLIEDSRSRSEHVQFDLFFVIDTAIHSNHLIDFNLNIKKFSRQGSPPSGEMMNFPDNVWLGCCDRNKKRPNAGRGGALWRAKSEFYILRCMKINYFESTRKSTRCLLPNFAVFFLMFAGLNGSAYKAASSSLSAENLFEMDSHASPEAPHSICQSSVIESKALSSNRVRHSDSAGDCKTIMNDYESIIATTMRVLKLKINPTRAGVSISNGLSTFRWLIVSIFLEHLAVTRRGSDDNEQERNKKSRTTLEANEKGGEDDSACYQPSRRAQEEIEKQIKRTMKHLIVGMIVLSINYGKSPPLSPSFIINDLILMSTKKQNFLATLCVYRFEASFAYQRTEDIVFGYHIRRLCFLEGRRDKFRLVGRKGKKFSVASFNAFSVA